MPFDWSNFVFVYRNQSPLKSTNKDLYYLFLARIGGYHKNISWHPMLLNPSAGITGLTLGT